MSNEALTWAFKQDLPMTEKFVLVSLADFADEAHSCFPSYAKTAARVGCHRTTAMRAIQNLATWGYLSILQQVRPNGSTSANRYVLNLDRAGVVAERDGGSSAVQPGVVAERDGGSSADDTPLPINEPSRRTPTEREPRKSAATTRGTRLPEGWTPPEHAVEAMRAERPDVDLDTEHRKFTDYWAAQPGQRGRKADWTATWRNWIRNARPSRGQEYKPGWQKRLEHAAAQAQHYRSPPSGGDLFAIER